MTNNEIFLEVRKADGAILSYFLERPTSPSTTVDYVQASREELTYLNALEDAILPAGMVATLSDLQDHRRRVLEAKATKETIHTKASQKTAEKPVESVKEASKTKLPATDEHVKKSIRDMFTRSAPTKPSRKQS